MNLRSYAVVTAAYWVFTISDGALRMLVLLHFHDLGYSPVSLAFLFLAYEFMGIVTNLLGGWVGSRRGLNQTLVMGLALQVVALLALSLQGDTWSQAASVVFVMGVQSLSGVAKDLTKMSAKTSVKFVAGEGENRLFRWVAVLTGSKNALKGVGFFVGGWLLATAGFRSSLWIMAGTVGVALVLSGLLLDTALGRAEEKTPIGSIFSKSTAINRLSIARLFLFGARDIWFVVALPIFLDDIAGWSFEATGAFLAAWVIGYGIIQSFAPAVVRSKGDRSGAIVWLAVLVLATAALAATVTGTDESNVVVVLVGLMVFGAIFAVNSSLHSYLILTLSQEDTALDVGFYYSANAAGRLIGTLLSGVLYLTGGLTLALWGSAAFLFIAWLFTFALPQDGERKEPSGRRWRPASSKLSASSQATNVARSSGHRSPVIPNQAVSRLRPL